MEVKDRHIRELYDELAAVRLAVDEARAKVEARELRVRDLEEERERLKERLREFEEQERKRRRWREGQDRRVARLEREIERREENIRNLEDLLEEKENERITHDREAQDLVVRKDVALGDALRRVEGLERDLEEREEMVTGLRATIETMQDEMDREYAMRRRAAGPANRLRAGIDLFNDSEQRQEVASISKSLGQPEVRVVLEEEGAEPAVILTFTWSDVTWRAYAANPGLAVEEPRVYQTGAGEDLSGVHREPSNAHVGPGGQVILGL
jgi:chromosome segregation ATPase